MKREIRQHRFTSLYVINYRLQITNVDRMERNLLHFLLILFVFCLIADLYFRKTRKGIFTNKHFSET